MNLTGRKPGRTIYKISEEFESCPDQIILFGVNCRSLQTNLLIYSPVFSFDGEEQPLNLNNGEMLFTVFCGPSTHFRSFVARSSNLSTLFLGKPPRQFTSIQCTFFCQ